MKDFYGLQYKEYDSIIIDFAVFLDRFSYFIPDPDEILILYIINIYD